MNEPDFHEQTPMRREDFVPPGVERVDRELLIKIVDEQLVHYVEVFERLKDS